VYIVVLLSHVQSVGPGGGVDPRRDVGPGLYVFSVEELGPIQVGPEESVGPGEVSVREVCSVGGVGFYDE